MGSGQQRAVSHEALLVLKGRTPAISGALAAAEVRVCRGKTLFWTAVSARRADQRFIRSFGNADCSLATPSSVTFVRQTDR